MYPLCNAPLWFVVTLELWWRKCGIPSRTEELIGDLEGETSSQPSWTRLSYDFLTVIPESRIIKYGFDSCVSDEMELLSDCSMYGDSAHSIIGDNGMGMLLMVPRSCASSC